MKPPQTDDDTARAWQGGARPGARRRATRTAAHVVTLTALLACACENRVGTVESSKQETGSQHVTQGFDAGADLSVTGASPVTSAALVAGTGDLSDVIFYAFTTATPAATFPDLADAAPADNSAGDVFLVAVRKLSRRLDDGTEQPIAFTQALRNTFRSARCTTCHGFHTEDPADTSFPAHPGGLTTNDNSGCSRCHTPELASGDGIEILEWRAPLAELGLDFSRLPDTEICENSRDFPGLEAHFERDSRILWTMLSGRLPARQLADPSDPDSEIIAIESRRRTTLPVSREQFAAQVDAWRRSGFLDDTSGALAALALVSAAPSGDEGNGASCRPSIAFVLGGAGGAIGEVLVAFQSNASDLVAEPNAGATQIYLARYAARRAAGEVVLEPFALERVSATPEGIAGDRPSTEPALSRDGRFVAFTSQAGNLVPTFTDGNGAGTDVFLRERATGAISLLSRSTTPLAGAVLGGDRRSGAPAISRDGSVVAFESEATDLVAGDGNGKQDVFVVATTPGAPVVLASPQEALLEELIAAAPGVVARAGIALDFESASRPDVFADGARTLVAYEVAISGGAQQVYLFNRERGDVTLLSQRLGGPEGVLADGDSRAVRFAPDGASVVFATSASNLDAVRPTDRNGLSDVVFVDLRQFSGRDFHPAQRLSITPAGDSGNLDSIAPLVDRFGSDLVVGFLTGAPADDTLLASDGTRLGNLGESDASNTVFQFLGPLEFSDEIATRLRKRNTAPECEVVTTPEASDAAVTIEIDSEVTFDGSGSADLDTGDAIVTYEWFVDGLAEATGSGFDRTFSDLGQFEVLLRVTDSFGVRSTCAVTVDVVLPPPPVASFRVDTTDCDSVRTAIDDRADLLLTFNNCTTGVVDSYLWDFGDGATSTAESPAHTYTTAGVYTVTLEATGIGGAGSDVATDLVTVRPRADFSFLAVDDAPFTVEFTNTSLGDPTGFLWDFGDGTTSTAENPTHVYASSDNYAVTLTVSRGGLDDANVQLIEAPLADFTPSVLSGSADLAVDFTNTTTGDATDYEWDFGDGTISNEENPSHTYLNAGNFEVTLTASGPGGFDTKDGVFITVDPVANFTASGTSGAAPFTVTFQDASTGNPTSFSWNFGSSSLDFCDLPSGSNTSTQENPQYTFQCPGTYTVTLTVSRAGRSDIETKTAYITATAPVSFATDIHPIFAANGCSNLGCHDNSGMPAAGMNLSGSAASTYPQICLRVDVDDPDQSLFYLNPTNTDPNGHGGGLRFATDSPEAMNILLWIETCAPEN